MAGITVDDLLSYGSLHADSAASWGKLVAGVLDNASFLQTNASGPLGDAWTGTAAELATSKINTTKGGLITSGTALTNIQSILEWFDQEMTSYSEQMKQAVAGAKDMVISPQGDVTYATAGPYTPAEQTKLTAVQVDVQTLLSYANQVDDATAQVLMGLMPPVVKPASVTTSKWTTVSHAGSLWQIAEDEYGDGNKWTLIYDANKAAIGSNPNELKTGMKLKIPAVAGSPGTPTGAKTGTADGPAIPAKPAAPAPSPTPGQSPAPYGDSTTPPPGVSPAEWNAS
jgi:hypothetical protein